MRIVIITQNEPFYLTESLRYLLKILPNHSKIVGCVVNEVSPFGKKESFIKKALKTLKIFGLNFFFHYSIKFLKSKINKKNNLKFFLNQNGIPIINLNQNINFPESVNKIKDYKPEILVSILGNQIFKDPIINLTKHGCLNLHSALLPKYRGLMPTFWVLKNNEKKTGVSVFIVDNGIDSGPIIVQKEIVIGDKNQEELIRETKKKGMEAIAKSIDLIKKNEVKLIKNDISKGSYFSFPQRQDVIEFKKSGKVFF